MFKMSNDLSQDTQDKINLYIKQIRRLNTKIHNNYVIGTPTHDRFLKLCYLRRMTYGKIFKLDDHGIYAIG